MGNSERRRSTIERLQRTLSLVLLWGPASVGGIVLLVTETPLVDRAARPLIIYGSLQRTDAIVVLGGGVRFDGELQEATRERLVYARI